MYVTTASEQMIRKPFLKGGISNKMARTENDVLCEDFLGEGVPETGDVADNNSYADYYDNSPANFGILDYN